MKLISKSQKIILSVFLVVSSFTFILALQNCFALDQQTAGNKPQTKTKKIAISFDDGPNGKYTKQVLAILKQNNVKATFFVCGDSTTAEPGLVKEEFDDGHEIGNHTYSHPNLTKLDEAGIKKELAKANDAIYKEIQHYPTVFRPPYGALSSTVKQVAATLGLRKVTWDFMINDYETNKVTPEIISSAVIQHAHSGAIITMHDGGGNREKTIAALPVIIAELKKQGYEFVTIAEILNIEPYHKF